MSKYDDLWKYISNSLNNELVLTYDEIEQISHIKLDHSFLTYKKELNEFGWSVKKISMKEKKVFFEKII